MRTVAVENATLAALAADPAAMQELGHVLGPLAEAIRKAGAGCMPCQQSEAARDLAAAYGRTKQALAALGPEDRAALKRRLGADRLLVHVADRATGRVTPVTL